MADAAEEHDGKVGIGVSTNTSVWFADDIDALAEVEQKQKALEKGFDKTYTRLKKEISTEKSKILINSFINIQREVKIKR